MLQVSHQKVAHKWHLDLQRTRGLLVQIGRQRSNAALMRVFFSLILWIWVFIWQGRKSDAERNCAIDLRCHHRWKGAFWHSLVDCILPVATYLERANKQHLCVCIDKEHMGWMQSLAPNVSIIINTNKSVHKHVRSALKTSECNCTEVASRDGIVLEKRAANIDALRRLELLPVATTPRSHTPIVYMNRTTNVPKAGTWF